MHPVAALALQWWRALPAAEQGRDKLVEYVDQFAYGHGLGEDLWHECYNQALQAAGYQPLVGHKGE
jgi:hypothetical protein